MRSLQSKPNVEAPSGSYPEGRIKDDDGSGTVGTPVDEQVYGDFHQFFEQLMGFALVTPNNLPENVPNGFQLNKALNNIFKMFAVRIGLGGADLGDGYNGGTTNIPTGHDLQTLPSQSLGVGTTFNGQNYFGGFYSVTSGALNVPIAGQAGTLIDIYGNATEEVQIFITDTQRAYFNVKTGSSWLGWVDFTPPPFNFKKIDIGDWDMSAATGTGSKSVTHGLTASKIIGIEAFIIPDAGSGLTIRPIDYFSSTVCGGNCEWDAAGTTILMNRTTGGTFDNVNYNATPFNRGYIIIQYTS